MVKRHDIMWAALGATLLAGYLYLTRADAPAAGTELSTTEQAIHGTQRSIVRLDSRLAAQPTSWLYLEQVAFAELGIAHLTGSYAAYRRAEVAIAEAFRRAPTGAGPYLARARLSFALHRLDDVEPDLQRAERALIVDSDVRRAIAELRASLAFQRGDLAQARRRLKSLLAKRSTVTARARLAQVDWKSGDYVSAEAGFLDAYSLTPRADIERRAWLLLMRGLLDLDRGRYDDALAHYQDADSVFDGWYLIEEHMAEIYLLKGELDEARRRYEALVAKTDNPEFMDALAEVYAASGRSEDADAMTARAASGYASRLAAYPEASYGHALDHYLDRDVARAVTLAERNAGLRPNGEALTKLATAYRRLGRHTEATRAIERALATGWATPDLLHAASDVFAAAGDTVRAESARARARRIVYNGSVWPSGSRTRTAPDGETSGIQ